MPLPAVQRNIPVQLVVTGDAVEITGVNDRAQRSLERAFQTRLADGLMADGVGVVDRLRIDIRGELQCGRDVGIDVNAVFEGQVVLGDGVKVGPNCC